MSEQKLYPVKLSCRRKSYSVQCEHCLIRELKQWRLDQQNRNFAHAAGFFVRFFDVDLKVPNFTVCGGRREHKTTTFFFFFLNSTLEFIFKKKNWPAFDDLNSLQYTVLKLHLYLLIASVFDGFIQTGH